MIHSPAKGGPVRQPRPTKNIEKPMELLSLSDPTRSTCRAEQIVIILNILIQQGCHQAAIFHVCVCSSYTIICLTFRFFSSLSIFTHRILTSEICASIYCTWFVTVSKVFCQKRHVFKGTIHQYTMLKVSPKYTKFSKFVNY